MDYGYPVLTTKDFKKSDLMFEDDQFLLKSKSINKKSGIISGSVKMPYVDKRGKTKYKSGKLYGVDVNGNCYGAGWIKKVDSAPIVFSRCEMDDIGE